MKVSLSAIRLRAVAFCMMICMCGPQLWAEDYKTESNLPYRTQGDAYQTERCKLDFYHPTGKKDYPVVVWFHGGGLEGGAKFVPGELKDSGLGVVAVNYRLLPKVGIEDCIDDAAAAVAWVFRHVAEYGGDPSRIFVAGHSAGGYLTDMVVLKKDYLARYSVDADSIKGAFPFSGQVITHFNVRKALGLSAVTPMVDNTAPLYNLRKLPMPLVLFSGDRELELYGRYEEQAYFWRMMLLNGNANCAIYELQGYDHGNMPQAAHPIMKRLIEDICKGQFGRR